MKVALLLAAFFALVGILTGSRPVVEGGDQVTVKFMPHWVTGKENLKAIRIKEDSENKGIVIELDQFRPHWASQAFPFVKFKAAAEDCQFIATDPMLFRCKAEPVAKTKAYGVRLVLESLEATHFNGQKISDNGAIEKTQLYAVDLSLKVGGKAYSFRVFADPKSVESITTKEPLPVAKKSLGKKQLAAQSGS